MVVTYYSVLIAWVIHGFFDSFGSGDPWAKEGTTGEEAVTYFLEEIIGTKTLGPDGRPTRLVGANVGYSALAWFLIWACLAGGTKWTGRITYFTMGLPIILLFVFLGKAVSLPGSENGIREYIGIWDMSVLTERPDCWSTAVSQIFFSIGVTFGIMTAFGSYNEPNEPAVLHSIVIAGANSMFSFISGFAVFASLGYLAYVEGVEVKELPFAGFSLVFGTWPVVFGTLPGGEHWVRLLFFDLFLLGIDSGFGLLEGGLTAAADTVYLSKYSKAQLAAMMSVMGFFFSLIYCTDAGLNFLDVVDFYINFVMLFVGFLETFAAGWIFGLEEQVADFGNEAVFSYFAANFGSIIVACGLWFGLENVSWCCVFAFVCLWLVLYYLTPTFYLNNYYLRSAIMLFGPALLVCSYVTLLVSPPPPTSSKRRWPRKLTTSGIRCLMSFSSLPFAISWICATSWLRPLDICQSFGPT
jgi:solute carrier family 6 GABA transporter-like protein 1